MQSLKNLNVVVVGGTSGIGLAVAQACAGEGAKVTVAGRTLARAEAAALSLGTGAQALAMDMRVPASVKAAFSAFEQIDHLVVTAVGDEYAFSGHPSALTDEQVELSLEKLRGYIHVARAASSRLAQRGSVTLVAGAGALKPPRGASLAAAANGAIISFARGLAVDLAPARANVVVPGPVETPLHGVRLEQVRGWTQTLPAAHFGQPADIAHAILFLLTNPYVTGSTLTIDGGYTIT